MFGIEVKDASIEGTILANPKVSFEPDCILLCLGLNGLQGLSDKRRARRAIDAVRVVLDAENLPAVDSHVHQGLVLGGKPKVAYFLVLAHEIGSRDPKRELSRWVACNFYDGEVTAINPYFPLEQILVLSPGKRVNNDAVVDA
jgi:hypothetical protein